MVLDREEIALRSGTSSDWSQGPILDVGELGLDITTGDLKYGDGTTAFASLKSINGGGVRKGTVTLAAGTATATGLTGVTASTVVVATVKTLGTVTIPKVVRAAAGTSQIVFTSEDNTDTSVVQYVAFG